MNNAGHCYRRLVIVFLQDLQCLLDTLFDVSRYGAFSNCRYPLTSLPTPIVYAASACSH